MTVRITPAEIVTFWREAGPDKWFEPEHEFDLTIRSRFFAVYEAAAGGRLAAWQESREGALALVLLLDQFPRNMFRGDARAFATDAMACAVADGALARGFDQATDSAMRPFFYLPFMHSEALADQDRCVRLYEALDDAEQLRYAREHREVIKNSGGSRIAIACLAEARHRPSGIFWMTMASPAERLIVRCHVTSAHAEQSIGFPQSPSGLSSRSRERIL
jgi:uncharacterized protein (DUF924 family)